MYTISESFHLPTPYVKELRQRPVPWGGGILSQATFYSRYSRNADVSRSGQQEHFADMIIRTIEGVMSIRKTWYRLIGQKWDDTHYQNYAQRMADKAFAMQWLPPGRSCYSLGTGYPESRGNASLNNCGFVSIDPTNPSDAVAWLTDHLMLGVGVGFRIPNAGATIIQPTGESDLYQISDDREGWVESFRRLVTSYDAFSLGQSRPVRFDYSLVRPKGVAIRGFGGVASGPEPLRVAHEAIRSLLDAECQSGPFYGVMGTELMTDIMNIIGICVIAGNVRRSAEIAIGSPQDEVFTNLKNYGRFVDGNWVPGPYSHRADRGYMSNNSVWMGSDADFEAIPGLVRTLLDRGEPGFINGLNIRNRGRYLDKIGNGTGLREDFAIGMNPCGEIPLEDKELCNLVEVFPTRHTHQKDFNETLEFATFFASTIALLPSHDSATNAVVARNRRTGVSLSGVADWVDVAPFSVVHRWLDDGYGVVRRVNRRLAHEAGVPESIRVTTIKPSGTVSLLPWVSPGMHHPTKNRFIRRIKMAANLPVCEKLSEAGVPWEVDDHDPNTLVFEFPMQSANGGKTRSVETVPFAEQCALSAFLARVWSDNAVSFTGTINKADLEHAERVITMTLPQVKSLSAMVNQDVEKQYRQLPYESIARDEYEKRLRSLKDIDWSDYTGSDGMDEKYCVGDACEVTYG